MELSNNNMFCTNCGKEILKDGVFCQNCGKSIKDVATSTEQKISQVSEQNVSAITTEECEKRKSRNTKIGLWWLIAPSVLLFATMMLYAVSTVILTKLSMSDASGNAITHNTIGDIIRILLGLVAIIALVGIMVGIPLGIIYLNKRVIFSGLKYDARSGRGSASEIPAEINHWNWAAAGLNWIWGVTHSVWISLLTFFSLIPFFGFFVSIIMLVYLGLEGNKLAWRADKWGSVEQFLASENKWKPWGIAFFVLKMLSILVGLAQFGKYLN